MKRIFSRHFWEQRDVELWIGKLLRYGVILACIVTFIGGFIYLLQSGSAMPNYRPVPTGETFLGAAEYLREFSGILPRLLEGDGAAIIQLGVIILIATPVIRVAFSAIAFLIERDYLYVFITILVLLIIMSNMFFGLH